MPNDAPDWLSIPGGYRYLGTLTLSGGTNASGGFQFTPTAYDGAVLAFPAWQPGIPTVLSASLASVAGGFFSANKDWIDGAGVILPNDPMVGFVNLAYGATWQVHADAVYPLGTSVNFYLFAAPAFPLAVTLPTRTPQVIEGNPSYQPVNVQGVAFGTPVVVSSAQLPAALVGGRLDGNLGSWMGSTAPTVGQKASAASLPVVIASDQSIIGVDTELPAAAALSDSLANPTTPLVGSANVGWSPSAATWRRILSDAGPMMTRARAAALTIPFTPVANTGATLTIPAGAAGTRQVITHLRFVRVATAALAGTALLTITTTNLSGPPSWRVGNAMAAGGTQIDLDQDLATPLIAAAAATAVTFVFPAPGAAVAWDCLVYYFLTSEGL